MFTVGICTSERKDYLVQALESLYVQTYQEPFEIVVSDDNSKDYDPRAVLSSLANAFNQKNIKLRLVLNPDESNKKFGEAAMRNEVIKHSSNDFIVWLDDDDRLIPTALSDYQEAISSNSEIDVFYGNLIRTDENLNPQQRYQYRDVPRAILPSSLLLGSLIPNGGSCIKKRVFEIIGLYDPSFIVATDYHFWARASLGPIRFKHVNKDIYLYRSHENNLALDKDDDRFYDSNGRVSEFLLQNCPPQYLFPFFEWKNSNTLAEYQVGLAVLTIAKRNRRENLAQNCLNELSSPGKYDSVEGAEELRDVFKFLAEKATLTYDESVITMSKIVELAMKNRKADVNNNKPPKNE